MPSDDRIHPTPDTTDVVAARIGAQVVDVLVTFAQLLLVAFLLLELSNPGPSTEPGGFVFLAALTLPLYGGVLEAYWNGQTLGKRLTGVRVVDSYGATPSFGAAALRNLPAVIVFGWLPALVALAAIATDDRHQRLFDRVAKTYVVDANAPPTDASNLHADRRHTPMSTSGSRN